MKTDINSILRVNHAGEYGAKMIYKGQLAVIRDKETRALVKEMYAQELEHLDFFESEVRKRQSRPSLFMPAWRVGAFFLGLATGILGKKAAMTCTSAVEDVISDHYQDQINFLLKNHPEESNLIEAIKKFREEEIEHKSVADSSDIKDYKMLYAIIKAITKCAIAVAKKY